MGNARKTIECFEQRCVRSSKAGQSTVKSWRMEWSYVILALVVSGSTVNDAGSGYFCTCTYVKMKE